MRGDSIVVVIRFLNIICLLLLCNHVKHLRSEYLHSHWACFIFTCVLVLLSEGLILKAAIKNELRVV